MMPNNAIQENIIKESERLQEDAIHSGKGHLNAASFWEGVHFGIGIPMTFCAAASGAQAFYDVPEIAITLALFAAVLGAVQTFLDPNAKANSHRTSGNKYLDLSDKVRLFREIELSQMEEKEAVQRIKQLSDNKGELNQSSRNILRCAYELAKKDYDEGRALHETDKDENRETR